MQTGGERARYYQRVPRAHESMNEIYLKIFLNMKTKRTDFSHIFQFYNTEELLYTRSLGSGASSGSSIPNKEIAEVTRNDGIWPGVLCVQKAVKGQKG